MRVAIAGAGWFGCHIASELILGGHEVTVFEASDDVFTGTSGMNQNRLHLGFHYPRSYQTREQSKKGFRLFVEQYPELSVPVPSNVYAIAEERSLVDFETYRQVMDATEIEYSVRAPSDFGLVGVSGAITCQERLVATGRARKHFREFLQPFRRLREPVTSVKAVRLGILVNGEHFDAIVSCTWGNLESHEKVDMRYESCLMLLYRGSEN